MSSGVLAIDIAYAFGLIVVVPLGVWLLGGKSGGAVGAFVLGAIATRGLFIEPETWFGAWLVAAWLLFAAVIAGVEVVRFLKVIRTPGFLTRLIRVAAPVFLTVSGLAALALRFGYSPFGFPPLVVALTAVHYLFTGFGAVLFSWKVATWGAVPRRSLALAGGLAVIVGTPVIATGITLRQMTGTSWFSVGESLGAIIIAVGLVLVAWQAFVGVCAAGGQLPNAARLLLRVPAIVVLFSMGLAVVYGLHRWLDTPALTERQMAETHGVLNALGFVTCGLLGWVLVARATPQEE